MAPGGALAPDLRFGTAGVPRSMEGASHLEGIRELGRLGLTAMELAFVRQVNVRPEAAPRLRDAALEAGVALSVHSPYYVNLNSRDPCIVAASRQRILRAAQVGYLCGARHVVFHSAWRHDSDASTLYGVVRDELLEVSRGLAEQGTDVWLCPETMGRQTQFGELDEVLALAQDVARVRPCIDFAHLHARRGKVNSEPEFEAILDAISQALGPAALTDLHMHVSGISFGPLGEKKHLTLEESDFDYRSLLRVLHRRGVSGRVVCESPANDADALVMQHYWQELVGLVEVS